MAGESPEDRREISGDGTATPPQIERSGSEGDRKKNSYRPSPHDNRLWLLAVGNDDGTPIAEETNQLLSELIAEIRALRAAVNRQG